MENNINNTNNEENNNYSTLFVGNLNGIDSTTIFNNFLEFGYIEKYEFEESHAKITFRN